MKDHHELAMEHFAQQATWMEKTGGYAKDMTLRDHFAALAMQELLPDEFLLQADIVKAAYQVADAMLEERNK